MTESARFPFHIAVEGPIRVGKSTLARILAQKLGARRIAEPENNPFLDRFYQMEPGMGFAAQMWFLMQRYEQLRQQPEQGGQPVVSDYIFEKDKIFAYINLTDAELELYNRYYQSFREQMRMPDLVLYLQATPEVMKTRLRRKGVPGERDISDGYLEQVAEAYEHFFFHYSASDLLVVNTSEIDFVNSEQDLQLLLRRIAEPVKGKQYFHPLASETAGVR
jgi:deoxyadenosine/deoxycytidine kinase